jgi:O-antigen ligase
MPEHLRALAVLLVIGAATFALARPLACAAAMSEADFARRRNLWFGLTLAAFLAHNFWIFIVFAAALVLCFALSAERNKLALYFFVLFAVPAISAPIPGFGLMEHFFTIEYLRLLALVILLPACLSLLGRPHVLPLGRPLSDKLLLGYLVLQFLLQLPHATFTETLRARAFYAFTDVLLPYYVASRWPRDLAAFRDALMAFAAAALVLAAIAVFEFAKRWLLYTPLEDALGVSWGLLNYLQRGESMLRAQASTGHPIILGYVLSVAGGFFLYLRKLLPATAARHCAAALLGAGLLAALSRGPWVGAAVMVLAFLATGAHAVERLAKLGGALLCLLPILLVTPAGRAVLDYLPFVGTVEAENLLYRERLFQVSLQVVLAHPWFGAFDFMQLPVMQQLVQGEGIIDIVNSYLQVALASGLVGLALFGGFFVAVAGAVLKAMLAAGEKTGETYLLGQALLATLLGILVIIATTSSMDLVPVIYWSVAGLGVAYARIARR